MARSQICSAEREGRCGSGSLTVRTTNGREARRERIAEASASALVALGRYVKATAVVDDATVEVGTAVRTLLAGRA